LPKEPVPPVTRIDLSLNLGMVVTDSIME